MLIKFISCAGESLKVKSIGKVNIIGSGLAGLSAAISLAENGIPVNLLSVQGSGRAQSNLAEGGINAALDVMGEDDTVNEHFEDTMKSGCYLADPEMVRGLTYMAPEIVRQLDIAGVPFNRRDGHIIQRNFGGQKKKRTAFAKSSTGKMIMTALTDAARRYEAQGLIIRFPQHVFVSADIKDGACSGLRAYDIFRRKGLHLYGPVIMACGGMSGMFAGHTTGAAVNTGLAAAELFCSGAELGNMELIQYHPTTFRIDDKRLLVSEAARGEGGRLFFDDNGKRNYFMEEKFGERGNLMPRDVVSREMERCGRQIFLDMSSVGNDIWENNLSDMREEIIHYSRLDPAKEPIPVSPGIHYFMGGILTDISHRTNIKGLFAAGECACAYHGANRLGGNSLLGALYGGHIAALSVYDDIKKYGTEVAGIADDEEMGYDITESDDEKRSGKELCKTVLKGMGILRNEEGIKASLDEVKELRMKAVSKRIERKALLMEAMLLSALNRKESRGAHVRTDYPETLDEYRKISVAEYKDGDIRISLRDI